MNNLSQLQSTLQVMCQKLYVMAASLMKAVIAGVGRDKEAAIVLTTLKQGLSGESGDENRESQLAADVAAFGRGLFTADGLAQSAFFWRQTRCKVS